MKASFTGLTDPGLVRSVNQDSYYIDPEGRFFIVADGMGGHAGGQEASQIAAQEIRVYLEENWDSAISSSDLLKQSLVRANQGILDDQELHPERKDMGTTVVVVLIREQPWCAHVGDSRLYLFRDGKLAQITHDHTWVAQALKAGEITAEQARVHPWRHVLSQCLGRREQQYPDLETFALQPRDILLLCSDGLTEEVADDLICQHLQAQENPQVIAEKLIQAAKDGGGSDNITIVLVNFQGD